MKSTFVLKHLSVAVLAGTMLSSGSAHAQSQPQAIRLREIKDLAKLDPNLIMGICNLPGLECNKVEAPRLFERKTEAEREFYAVTANRTISRLTMKASGQWELLHRWSFDKYPLPMSADGSEARMIDIHPALYPTGSGMWAVAVLNRTTESYSGGGAEFVTADFITLDPETLDVGEAQRRFGGVPFSCSKMVRACFTEKEYKTSPHCHGENNGYLMLRYTANPTSPYYDWTATWNETSWPAGVTQSAQKTTRKTLALKPGSQSVAPDAFAFCAGGPADP